MAEQKKVKVVLVGCGGIANAWLNPTKDFADVEIVGLVDIKPENIEKVRAKHGLAAAVGGQSVGAVVEQTGADVVFDCTVPGAHAPVTIEALRHGCHVLGEKPMADTLANARRMVATAKECGRIYAVIQNRRYLNDIIRYRDVIQGGQIGGLTTLNADFYLGCHFGGFRDVMDHVLLLDMAIHSFDEARFISGCDPVSVYCHEWNPQGSWYKHGASAVAIFEMTGGVVFTYRGSWCAEGLNTSWECEWRGVGSNGSALWGGGDKISAAKVVGEEGFTRTTEAIPVPEVKLPHTGHKALIREFVDCVRNGGVPQTICTDNIKSLAMVEAAIESAESGVRVKIEI